MKRIAIPTLIAMSLLVSGSALASGDIAAGKDKAATCAACHGADGNSTDPQYPRLAGQWDSYLLQALKEYKSGKRDNPIMKGFASNLSTQDMEDLASYFSSLPGKLDDLSRHVQGSD